MKGFPDSLLIIRVLCEAGFYCTIANHKLLAYDPTNLVIKILSGAKTRDCGDFS